MLSIDLKKVSVSRSHKHEVMFFECKNKKKNPKILENVGLFSTVK